MSERTFRRWRERYEAEGAAGLYDRRLGRVSARRAPVDDAGCWSCSRRATRTSRQALPREAGLRAWLRLSYNWLRLSLQAHAQDQAGAQTRGAPPEACLGVQPARWARSCCTMTARAKWVAGLTVSRVARPWMIRASSLPRRAIARLPRARLRGDRPLQAGCARRRVVLAPRARQAPARVERTTRPRSAGPWRSSASS